MSLLTPANLATARASGKKLPASLANLTEFDPSVDYVSKLKDSELKKEGKRTFVYLKGLERLAKERGVSAAVCTKLDQLGTSGVFCTYQYTFWDGATYQGSADATTKNCEGKFKLYLTAMAESRAKARALRTAFGINLCSVEEKADVDVADDVDFGPAEDHQLVAIKNIAKAKGLGSEEILSLMEVPKKKLEKLTRQEARDLMTSLNEWKPAKTTKKKTVRKTAGRK